MRARIIGLTVSMMLLFAVMIVALHHARERQNLLALAKSRLLSIAVTAAAALDGDAHAELNRCMDISCPNYRKLAAYLRQVQESNGLDTEIYTLARFEGGTRFVLRTRKEADFGVRYELRPEMLPAFEDGRSVVTGFYEDGWGTWVSAYAPIRDSRGEVVAILEADHEAGTLLAMLFSELRQQLLLVVSSLALGALLASRLAGHLTRTLDQLTAAVEAAARSDFEHPLPRDAPAEVGLLARRFAEMREAVVRAQQAERLALLGRMVNGMIHDLRGPLTAIAGMVQLMPLEETEADRLALGERALHNVFRIEAMARDVLEFSRGTSRLHRERIELGNLLHTVREDLEERAGRKQVEVRIEASRPGSLWGDFEKLRRMLGNIAGNAVDASPAEAAVLLGWRSGDGRVVLTVADRAGGIPVDLRDSLFEPFVTHGKVGGTGLGLTIARSFAEAHGGSVTFAVDEGVGTTFEIDLPEDRAEVEEPVSPIRELVLAAGSPPA